MKVSYPSAQVRGQMRAFKQHLDNLIEPLSNDHRLVIELADSAREMICRGTVKGRQRGLKHTNRILKPAGAVLQRQNLTGNQPFAIWRFLRPEDSPFTPNQRDKQLLQACVTVRYLAVIRDPTKVNMPRLKEGIWGLIVPDHALGRAIARTSNLTPHAIIESAHDNLLRCRVEAVLSAGKLDPDHSFCLRAGDGFFVCRLGSGETAPMPWVFAYTWIAEAMRGDNQIVLAEDGEPGEQLGDTWLLPSGIPPSPPERPNRLKQFLKKRGVKPLDLRQPLGPDDAERLIRSLAKLDVVWCEYSDGTGTGALLKGEDIVQHGVVNQEAQTIGLGWLIVANTTQIELLAATLQTAEDGTMDDTVIHNLVGMLEIAATLPGGQHDNILFEAAMERLSGRPTGAA